jgi:hypothetical protein
MCAEGIASIILTMTHRPTQSKVLIVSDSRSPAADPAVAPIRRYQIARLRRDARQAPSTSRFEQTKR